RKRHRPPPRAAAQPHRPRGERREAALQGQPREPRGLGAVRGARPARDLVVSMEHVARRTPRGHEGPAAGRALRRRHHVGHAGLLDRRPRPVDSGGRRAMSRAAAPLALLVLTLLVAGAPARGADRTAPAEDDYARGVRLLDEGEWTQALPLYQKITREHPTYPW